MIYKKHTLSNGKLIHFQKIAMRKNKVDLKLYSYEQKFWNKNLFICGIDEVGRGCLAGPVVTAAAVLHKNAFHPDLIDSKKLSSAKLISTYEWLIKNCFYTIGINSARIIDQKNIYQTTKLTMIQALLHLLNSTKQQPSLILIDAMPLGPTFKSIECLSLIKGESHSASIAAASIIAKVTRDKILQRLHKNFPLYNLKQHKGYATKDHQKSLQQSHSSIIHRQTFLTKIIPQKDFHEQRSIFC